MKRHLEERRRHPGTKHVQTLEQGVGFGRSFLRSLNEHLGEDMKNLDAVFTIFTIEGA